MEAIEVKFYGMVQGVGFRAHVRKRALELGIKGYVKNCDDGSVEAIFEGDDEMVSIMLAYCKKIPMSDVTLVETKNLDNIKYNEFTIEI